MSGGMKGFRGIQNYSGMTKNIGSPQYQWMNIGNETKENKSSVVLL